MATACCKRNRSRDQAVPLRAGIPLDRERELLAAWSNRQVGWPP